MYVKSPQFMRLIVTGMKVDRSPRPIAHYVATSYFTKLGASHDWHYYIKPAVYYLSEIN